MKTHDVAAIALAALGAASPLSTTVSRVITRPLHVTFTSTEEPPPQVTLPPPGIPGLPPGFPSPELEPHNPWLNPGPVIDPDFTNLPLEVPAAEATTSVPVDNDDGDDDDDDDHDDDDDNDDGGDDDDDDSDDNEDDGHFSWSDWDKWPLVDHYKRAHGDRDDHDPDPDPYNDEFKCYIPEGCVYQLPDGTTTTIGAGDLIPTLLLGPIPTATSTPARTKATTTRKHHHRPTVWPIFPTRTGRGHHPPKPTSTGRHNWFTDCKRDKGAFGCLSELPSGIFITQDADGKPYLVPAPTKTAEDDLDWPTKVPADV